MVDMSFYKIRDSLLKGDTLASIPLRATFYARVSTERDEQINSLENQVSFFKEFIKKNRAWVYVDGYVDLGKSGSSTAKRTNFLRMIEDAKKGLFDIIITKEVSRFSRSLLDSIKYTQMLMKYNVGVYFQSNGINTYDPNSEFILNMMGSVAQEEVKRLSARIKWGHMEAIKKGHLLGSGSIIGYYKDGKKLIINEEEAFIVRNIFELYASDKYGFYALGQKLFDMGICNSRGNIFDKDTLKRIIQNPKYKGFYRGHTTEVIDYRTKLRKKVPVNEQIIYKDASIPAIVSEKLWNKANNILKKRSNLMKKGYGNARIIQNKYCYSSKIYCSDDKMTFQRISSTNSYGKKIKWACGNYTKYGVKACLSPIILEQDLDNLFKIIIQNFITPRDIAHELYTYYTLVSTSDEKSVRIKKIKKKITLLKVKKEKLLEIKLKDLLDDDEFDKENQKYKKEIMELQRELLKIKDEDNDDNSNLVNNIFDRLFCDSCIRETIFKLLDYIIVQKNNGNRHNLTLCIYLKVPGNVKKTLLKEFTANSIDEGRVKNYFIVKVWG